MPKLVLEKETKVDGKVEWWVKAGSAYLYVSKDEAEARRIFEEAKEKGLPKREIIEEFEFPKMTA